MSRVLTYDEISDLFGINRRSAAQLVKRRRWNRRKGNDGRARIEVPDDAVPPAHEVRSDDSSDSSSDDSSDDSSDTSSDGQLALLKHLVERLEAEVAELRPKAAERDMLAGQNEVLRVVLEQRRQEREAEHQKAAERDVFAVQLEAEQRRSEELRQERDAEHQRASDRDALAAQLDAERRRSEELRAERDRWAVQAHVLAHPPAPPASAPRPSRSLLGWFRAARR
jgi:hypothetical protein